MKDTDRFIVEIPGVVVKKLSMKEGVPVVEHFTTLGGATYDAMTYEMVVGIEMLYAKMATEMASYGEATIAMSGQPAKPMPRTGTGG